MHQFIIEQGNIDAQCDLQVKSQGISFHDVITTAFYVSGLKCAV